MNKKIAIQGIKGSFHHIATKEYFNTDTQILSYLSFDETVNSLLKQQADQAIMAIENSIAGSIIPNYALIDKHDLFISGEYYLNIQHNLMALKGQSIEDIKEVHSHPMALLQCKDFFESYPHIKLVEDKDTAEVARRIQEGSTQGIAAIASALAADIFELNILAESIQTVKNNQTRFVIVNRNKKDSQNKEDINKASLRFELDHKRGSLAALLNVMSDCRLNLTKIQSLPIIETPWKYAFFVDVRFDEYAHFQKAVSLIEIMAENFKLLGEYKNASL